MAILLSWHMENFITIVQPATAENNNSTFHRIWQIIVERARAQNPWQRYQLQQTLMNVWYFRLIIYQRHGKQTRSSMRMDHFVYIIMLSLSWVGQITIMSGLRFYKIDRVLYIKVNE